MKEINKNVLELFPKLREKTNHLKNLLTAKSYIARHISLYLKLSRIKKKF